MNIPDIEGFLLGRALEVLKSRRDIKFSISVTGPPRGVKDKIDYDYRVVRVKAIGKDGLEITVCDPEP